MNAKRHQFTLRLNEELDKKIETISKNMGVSKNALILMVLDRGIKSAG